MAGGAQPLLSRRGFLGTAGGAAAALSIAPSRVFAQPTAQSGQPLGDVHVHLFNITDLPARGFFEHVVLWNSPLRHVRWLWPAILDLIVFFKTKTITAEAELKDLRAQISVARALSPQAFKQMAFNRIRALARQSPHFPGNGRLRPAQPYTREQAALRVSYQRLSRLVAQFSDFRWAGPPEDAAVTTLLSDREVDAIRVGATEPRGPECLEEPDSPTNPRVIAMVRETLKWAYQMMQSRQAHLTQYRKEFSAGGRLHPVRLVNLLVDYDAWLGDSPAAGSSHDSQIALWSHIAKLHEGEVDIRTFAGFDPLKDAEERLNHRLDYATDSQMARYRRFLANSSGDGSPRIDGFKLYPPMGFRPIGNMQEWFAARTRAGRQVRMRWMEKGLPFERLAEKLNESLTDFYRFCVAQSVPILTHGFHSNEAGRCFGARAGPRGWLEVFADHPDLRLCIGHFAEADDLALGLRRRAAGRPVPARVWPLHGTEKLLELNTRTRSRVFADIGYMSELLIDGGSRAVRFFTDLKAYCEAYDPECRHFLFGSDWIMLAREPRHHLYAERILDSLAAAHWSPRWQRNLLHDNLERFLAR